LPLQAEGEFALVKEKLEQALALSGQPVKRGTMAHKHIVYMMLADSAAQLRDEAGLMKYASLLEKLAVQDDHQPYLAVAHRAWGIACRLAGDYAEAETRLKQALELFGAMEARWQTGRTLYELAELKLAQSDLVGARDYYMRALTEFEALQATPDFERTKAAIETLG
jgi:tetratricopeptide (TPR) repeat protein